MEEISDQRCFRAQVKIYLTASAHTRAMRRIQGIGSYEIKSDIAVIEADINERDHRDMTREISPLCQAWDAVLIDSSDMSIDEVTEAIKQNYMRSVSKHGSNTCKTAGFCLE